MRSGYKMPPATCAKCGKEGPQKNVARRQGWQPRGPQQRRRWYCPACPSPPVVVPNLPAAVPMPRPPSAPDKPPSDPFAALRAERDQECRQQAADAQQHTEVTSPFWQALYGLDKGDTRS